MIIISLIIGLTLRALAFGLLVAVVCGILGIEVDYAKCVIVGIIIDYFSQFNDSMANWSTKRRAKRRIEQELKTPEES